MVATPLHAASDGPHRGRAVVVTGGGPLPPDAVMVIDDAALVIAADSGLDHLWALDRTPHLVVGDLDSVSPVVLAQAREQGVPVDRHPVDKDATDTELAVKAARDRGHEWITVMTGGGDRLDHVLGWLGVLADPRLARLRRIDAWCATTHVAVLHAPRELHWFERTPNELVSLVPLSGACHGVTTHGLRWALDDASLSATSSRGLSNIVVGTEASVSLSAGVLAVIRPHRHLTSTLKSSPTTGGDHGQ